MKHPRFALAIAAFAALSLASCHKEEDEGLLPGISLKTGGTYLSKDTTVSINQIILTGIHATKSEDKDVLKSFSITRSYDSSAEETVYTEAIPGASEDVYDHDHTIVTRSIPGKERYTYTVVNRDGLVNTVRLTLTVQ